MPAPLGIVAIILADYTSVVNIPHAKSGHNFYRKKALDRGLRDCYSETKKKAEDEKMKHITTIIIDAFDGVLYRHALRYTDLMNALATGGKTGTPVLIPLKQ